VSSKAEIKFSIFVSLPTRTSTVLAVQRQRDTREKERETEKKRERETERKREREGNLLQKLRGFRANGVLERVRYFP
jgi:hypothetical protein